MRVSTVGNLASFRNRLPAGEQPRALHVLLREAKGRRSYLITPKADGLRASGRERQWDEVVSRALFGDPTALSRDMTVTMGDGKTVTLSEIADLGVAPGSASPAYRYLSIDDEARRQIEEPARLPVLAVTTGDDTGTLRAGEVARVWAAAVGAQTTPGTTDDVTLFLRLPNVNGYPGDQIEAGTLVTAVSLRERVISIAVTMDPGRKPALAPKDVSRPLLVLSLGWLPAGAYRVQATITGHPDGALNAEHAFTVK
jgi:hypothetical protein